jgi:hypothetical protein
MGAFLLRSPEGSVAQVMLADLRRKREPSMGCPGLRVDTIRKNDFSAHMLKSPPFGVVAGSKGRAI